MTNRKIKPNIKKWIVIALFVAAAVLSAVFAGKVAINYNLADYLGKDSQTKIALDVIEDEFGMTGNLQVMAKNVSADTAEEMRDKIKSVKNVLNVNFDKYDEAYYKDGNALFVVIIDGDDYSENAKQVSADVRSALSSYEGIEYGGTTIEKQNLQNSITSEMGYILAVALCLIVAILLITSDSWLEPIVLLASSGVAILINRGTNIFFGEISYITNSIAACLQLALSMDYSIVLLHAYRKEKEKTDDASAAMHTAILSVIKPVSASALTTIAGLLALLFMSFRIGFDIGMVLMKGIVISAITSVTLLPALILLSDGAMKRTKKKAFVPKGKIFYKTAYKASKGIVPIALAVIVACGFLQTGNVYFFTDTKAGNKAITEVFGENNSVVAVYKNTENNFENEQKLADTLAAYRTKDGKKVLSDYTAYTNTVRELYDLDKAVKKLELSEKDTEALLTMYNLYRSPDSVGMTFANLIDFTNELVDEDEDVKAFVDADTAVTLKTLKAVSYITANELTAEQLYKNMTADVMKGGDVSLFSIKQLYGLYFYGDVEKKDVNFNTMLDFIVTSSANENIGKMFDENTVTQLKNLSAGVEEFGTQMKMPMTKETLRGWFYQNAGVTLTDEQLSQIWVGYFAAEGGTPEETIPFLPLMQFLVQSGQITNETTVAEISGYAALDKEINSEYEYEEFLSALAKIATALSGTSPRIDATNESVQQLYILYFYSVGSMPDGKINGKDFAGFALDADKTNAVIRMQLTDENRNKLSDMLTVSRYLSDRTELTYETAYEKMSAMQEEIKSDNASTAVDRDKISGVFVKYLVADETFTPNPVTACDLLDFITRNMDVNSLLKEKITDENRSKISDAQEEIAKATDLFCGKNYSRMLLSLDLPGEGTDTTEFVEYLSEEVKNIFGDEAYITGEIVSTYDLEKSFDHDNTFITVFTLISIFVIVMIVFRSLSLPVILVTIIQGSIFIAMSTQLLGNGIFFMSYIVSTCILMGATIDYGILMSSNYVAYRGEHDKKEALKLSVQTAMPTIFTSGLIMTVCGFVIHFVSGQNSISTVGLLIGIGTICSVVMITLVLPSVLYLLDKFVLKLSFRKKN